MIIKKTTKEILADSIVELMLKYQLDNISVQDIVNNCGLSRRTFYNNFSDKYQLIEWIYQQDVLNYFQFVGEDRSWYSAIINKLNIIKSNKAFYSKVYRQEYFLKSFYKITKNIHMDLVKKHRKIDSELEFIIEFYCYACVGETAKWIRNGMKEDPEELLEFFIKCLPDTLKDFIVINK